MTPRSKGSIRAKVILASIGIALATSIASFPTALVYYERRIDGLSPEVRDQVNEQVLINTPNDFDGIAELAIAALVAAATPQSSGQHDNCRVRSC